MQRSSPLAAALSRTLSHRASTPRPLAPLASSSRLFSSSPPSPARSTANRPKRDPTTYGLPLKVPRKDWPTQDSTDTSHHPLWRFFHDQQPLEAPDKRVDYSSRPWTAPELRALPFDQLHALWYVLLRERNVLLTQREEARRVRVDLGGFSAVPDKLRMCQKSMARIKQVLSERRHAALEAAEILRARGDAEGAERVEQSVEGDALR
ncbi:mitochondrial 39-S ribosomal protein L47 (MRP-L47)-domain-containing protein [Rhodotorula diobovata]|uniref:Large ribosomal subunit protein uL29m n=1 Tax=Rhodotorula diobovata TaxID=5288 RepID=A0A5C5FS12_9BASI|nr:mitochondrial 39-S ribosomal protein L47 (MRP-L47)-domain-containing protein [Rhodotorula diobovata]